MICLQRSPRIFVVVQSFHAGNMHYKPTHSFCEVAVFSSICTILPLFDRNNVLYFLERTIAREQITFVSSNDVVLSRKMFHNHLSTRRRSNEIGLQIDRLTDKYHNWGSSKQRWTPNFERMDIFHHSMNSFIVKRQWIFVCPQLPSIQAIGCWNNNSHHSSEGFCSIS